ncbi:MAG: PAS domain S-box protein [bacterium]|nr:PAS domain S-box protein [bacterium]
MENTRINLKIMKRPKYLEEALQKSEERYRLLVETSQSLIFQCDLDWNFIYLNNTWEKTHGYKIEEMTDRKFSDFQSPENAKKDLFDLSKQLKGGIVNGYESTHISKTGEEIVLWLNMTLTVDKDWKVTGYQGSAQDITEYKKTERALRESEERFRLLFEKASDGIFISEPHLKKFISVNRAMAEMIGYTKEEMLSLNVSDIFCKEDLNSISEEFNTQMNSNKIILHDMSVVKKDNTKICVELNSTAMILNEKNCLVGIVRDISERKLLEEERLLREKFQGVLELSGAACHELNQPLQVISGYTELLLAGMTEENSIKDKLIALQDNIRKLGGITDKLQNITKYETKGYLTGKIIDIDRASQE